MFVRWKKRACKQWHSWSKKETTLSAYLVKSERIDGKPRQKVIAFLGSIRQDDSGDFHFSHNVWHRDAARMQFLEWMERYHLQPLDITDEQKQAILEQVYKVVPPLTDEEKAPVKAQEAEGRAMLAAFRGR